MHPVTVFDASDPRVADFVRLRGRVAPERVLIAESELVVRRLLASHLRLRAVLVQPSRYERMRDAIDAAGVPVYLAERALMERIAGYDVHRGVLASAERPSPVPLDHLAATTRRLIVLEGSNDTENLGAVARSARGLGFGGMLLDPTCADPFSRRSVRVSMGEVLFFPVVRAGSWPRPIDELAGHGFETWALTPAEDAPSLFSLPAPERVALVAGAEGPGLSATALTHCTRRVRIPMHHGVDSLNLGHALAVAMAHTTALP